ncbi:MAG TPA: winged helix-turn-helix domain-containing protein [Xanthomonadales bacterium]|nr:winged helix-turn-helix domain-containing protein [Xanthomonadales bacterium]
MTAAPASAPSPEPAAAAYRFGPFTLEPRERRLVRDGVAVDLRPKAFEALVLLVTRAGSLVGKEEFFAVLWPRVIVGDASLNKCVWQLRQALGDEDGRYIETVPKAGYRFVAPVERIDATSPPVARAPDAVVAPPPPAAPKPRWRWHLVAAGTAILLLVLQLPTREPAPQRVPTSPPGATHVLAIAGIEDLNPRAETAWLAPALLELASAQFAGVDTLRVVPAETLRDFGFDPLSSARANPLALPAAIRADWRLTGSYVVIAAAGLPPEVQVSFAVTDAATGEERAQASRRGLETDLFELAAAAGAELRQELALTDVRDSAWSDGRNVLPSDAEARRAYGEALVALRRFDLLAAAKALQETTARAPDFAPAHAALAQAWTLLGHDGRAREAIAAAERLSKSLPRTVALDYAAQAAALRGDWPKAIESWQALATLDPENPEPALRLATAQVRGGEHAAAVATLDRLVRGVPASGEDPRVLFTRARAEYMQGRNEQALADAERARALAERHRAPLLAAEAALHQGWALQMLGRRAESDAAYGFSKDTFANAGHGVNAARAGFQQLQLRFGDEGQFDAMAPQMAELLALARSAGSRRVESSVLSMLANLQWAAKRYAEERRTLADLLALERELGNRSGEVRALIMTATVDEATGAGDAAIAGYESAAKLARDLDDDSDLAWALVLHADFERVRGHFDAAARLLDEAAAASARIEEPAQQTDVDYHRAILALDRNDIDAGTASIASAAERAERTGDRERIGLVAGVQGELALARGDLDAAWKAAELALGVERELARPEGPAWFAAFGAKVRILRGERDAAAALIASAEASLPKLATSLTGLTTRLYLADSRWLLGEREPARARWREVEADARRRGLAMLALEAAIGLACDDPSALAVRVAEARTMGFGRGVAWSEANCNGRKP